MKRVIALVVILMAVAFAAQGGAHTNPWACKERAPDGQCIIRVAIAGSFPAIDKQVIREVLADFSTSPNIEVIEDKPSDVTFRQGCVQGMCGFFTDMRTRTVYIDKAWSYANYCCDSHDGMRGVYCHEGNHAIAGIGHPERTQPSCHNGTSPYLGVEDFRDIAITWPLPNG